MDYRLRFHAEDSSVGAAHSEVRYISASAGEHCYISRCDMSMCSYDYGEAYIGFHIEIAREEQLLGCSFGVEVAHCNIVSSALVFQNLFRAFVRGSQGFHIHAAEHIHDEHPISADLCYGVSHSGSVGGVVCGSYEVAFVVESAVDFLALPCMVSAGDDIRAAVVKSFRGFGRHSVSHSGVLAVHYDKVSAVFFPQLRQLFFHERHAAFSHDIAEKQYFYHILSVSKNQRLTLLKK